MKWTFTLLVLCLQASAQMDKYPQNYFRNPLNIPILLAGNFGECRPGHFHSGIDIKTMGKENLPVFAAADGYISRVKMEPSGFGHGIYITHPNGYTTLYAHLNNFFPALQKLVHETQYQNKNWELDLKFEPEKFPIKKGQQIAWSGNTGGSSAPHLHFEIRDTKTEHPLNPQLFGFEIIDNISPIPTEIVLYPANESIYIVEPKRYKLVKKGGFYTSIKDSIWIFSNKLNIGVAVHDYMNNSTNTLSFYTAKWFANDTLIGTITLDNIGYDETRYLNACADYKLRKETGTWYNSLFLLPNNQLKSIYKFEGNVNGTIELKENEPNNIRIVLTDVLGNVSEIKFTVFRSRLIPGLCNEKWKAQEINSFENPNIQFTLPNTALYDDICFQQSKKYDANSPSSRWTLMNASIPVHKYFLLNIKPEVVIPFTLTYKMVMRYSDGKQITGKMAKLKDGWYSASVRAFGDYWLAIDTLAPTIKALQKSGTQMTNKKSIRFQVTDALSSIKEFKGMANGQWLCFEQHGQIWTYTFDEYCPKGKTKIELAAMDENGNEAKMDFLLQL